jgi:hypothetical protein
MFPSPSILSLLAALAVVSGAPAAAQNASLNPNYGTYSLSGGFTPDPGTVSVRAGGNLSARNAGSHCTGFITEAPDVRLNFSPGSLPLILSVFSNADTSLIINAPDGRFYCDDDGGVNGLNPAIRFNRPMAGRYEIWIGTYRSGQTQAATLHISEVTSQ